MKRTSSTSLSWASPADRDDIVLDLLEEGKRVSGLIMKHRRDPEMSKVFKEKLVRIYFRLAVAEMADARDELLAEERGKERNRKLFRYSLDKMAAALDEANAGMMEVGRMQPYLSNARSFAVTAREQRMAHEFRTGPYAGLMLIAEFLSDGGNAIGDDELDELANLAWCARRLPADVVPTRPSGESEEFSEKYLAAYVRFERKESRMR